MGRYLFLREIAQGPFGPLHEARTETDDGALQALVRVAAFPQKLSSAEEQSIAQAAWDSTEIGHDGVLRVADAVFGPGWLALVHDHSEGSLLSSLRLRAEERQTGFPTGVAVRIALDILASLAQSQECCESVGLEWSAGSVALTSLYLCGDGRTRLLDGQLVAAALKWESLRALPGATAYAAPELLDPRLLSDERSDVFSVGVVLWELLTGKQLLPGDSTDVALRLLQELPSVAPSMPAGASMPRGLPQALGTALSLEPAKRFATRAEFANALSDTVDEVGGYDKVIDFTDVLLHRGSTLFRLDLVPPPQLSQKLPKSEGPDRGRPQPPRARGKVPRATAPRKPMVVVSAPEQVPGADAAHVEQEPAREPEKAVDLESSLAQLRQTLIGMAGPSPTAPQGPMLSGVTAPKTTTSREPSPPGATPSKTPAPHSPTDAGSVRIMTLLGLSTDGAGPGRPAAGSPAGESLGAAESAVTRDSTGPSEPPTVVLKASALAAIARLACQDTTVSLAEGAAAQPVPTSPPTAEPEAPEAEAKPAKRTVQIRVTTLVAGFAATILFVVVVMLLLQRGKPASSARPAPEAREPAALTSAPSQPDTAPKPSTGSKDSRAPEPGFVAEPTGASASAPVDTAPPQASASAAAPTEIAPPAPAGVTPRGASPATKTTPPAPLRNKAKKRYVPSDL